MMTTGILSTSALAADANGGTVTATYTKNATTFKVWSPKASAVSVEIFSKGNEEKGVAAVTTSKLTLDKSTGVWSVTINGDYLGKYYEYVVTHGKESKRTADIYARACGVNGKRSMIVDLAKTNPDGWNDNRHIYVDQQTNASVWEISVADFSSSETSGVSEENRGKYLAFTESGTTVNGVPDNAPTCVDYLKRLGVKYVQIMPMYDFGSVDESKDIMSQYNWGYDPVNYNVPEGSYSSDPNDGFVRIRECKQMIQALHNAGIGVIMDVVYNHTFSTDSWFQYTVPNYYYRMNSDGTFSNGSGCSNDTASEHLMFRKYMVDSVTYWAKEYHIDGFRFDLMGLHDVTTMNEIRDALDGLYKDGSGKKILMYGEAWDLKTNADQGTVLATQQNVSKLNDRIGAFNDTVRDAIKGSVFNRTEAGFVQKGSKRSGIKDGFLGQSHLGWANVPTQCVNYASCHDNVSLYDKLVDSVLDNDEYRERHEELVAMNKLSASIIFTSQGIPFFLGGEEFARSKDGDENSYSSSREENMLDWTNVEQYSDLVEYYRGLMKIRNNFAAFNDCTAITAKSITSLDNVPSGVSAFVVPNTEAGKWNKMLVVFNGSDESQKVPIEGEWIKLADENFAGINSLGECSDKVEVEAHSAVILCDKAGYEKAGIKDDEGVVAIDYYDNGSKEIIKKEVISQKYGNTFDVKKLASKYNYDVKSVSGDEKGQFEESPHHIKVYVKPYTGKMSDIFVKFVDDDNPDNEVALGYKIECRENEKYYTTSIASVENYRLLLDKLPDNAAGTANREEITVTFRYKKVTDEDEPDSCRVNVIYMLDNGSVIETETLTGNEGEAYNVDQKEYEERKLVEVPREVAGAFQKGEINVILNYKSTPDPMKTTLRIVMIALGVISGLCVASVIVSRLKRKKKLRAAMDIENSLEPKQK